MNKNPALLIDWFDEFMDENDYWFLSNFAEGFPFTYKGSWFPTSEHAYAFAKVDPLADDASLWADLIMFADDPGVAKAHGRGCPLRPDWEEIKFNVMREIVFAKFTSNPEARRLLLATGDAYLQEGTFWGDTVWGVIYEDDVPFQKRKGTNWLGTILMEIRGMLRATDLLETIHEDACRAFHKGNALVMCEFTADCYECIRIREERDA
jgi:ribA/ribD-fused uncharacterized protein